MQPRIQSTTVESTRPQSGISKRLSTLLQSLEPGIAPSLAKAYVQRLAAVSAPTPAKNRIPRIRKSRPKPPAAEPVAILKIRPMGWPLATERSSETLGSTKRIGIKYMMPVNPAAATERTMALGTSRSGIWTSSHIAATIP